jgi:DNA polymerase III delta subunit
MGKLSYYVGENLYKLKLIVAEGSTKRQEAVLAVDFSDPDPINQDFISEITVNSFFPEPKTLVGYHFDVFVNTPGGDNRLLFDCLKSLPDHLTVYLQSDVPCEALEPLVNINPTPLSPFEEKEVRTYLAGYLKNHQITIEKNALNTLLTDLKLDLRQILNYLELLHQYTDGKPIGSAEVSLLVPKPLEERIFELTGKLAKREKSAFSIYQELVEFGYQPEELLGAITKKTRDLLLYGALKATQTDEALIMKRLGLSSGSFYYFKQAVNKVEPTKLREFYHQLASVDLQLKGANPAIVSDQQDKTQLIADLILNYLE